MDSHEMNISLPCLFHSQHALTSVTEVLPKIGRVRLRPRIVLREGIRADLGAADRLPSTRAWQPLHMDIMSDSLTIRSDKHVQRTHPT